MKLSYKTKDNLLLIGVILFLVGASLLIVGWTIVELLVRLRFITEGAC